MRPRRNEKIQIRINYKFRELLNRMKRLNSRQTSNADILCLALGKYVFDNDKYYQDSKILDLATQIMDIKNKNE